MPQNLDALRLALQHSPDNVPLLLLFAEGCLDEGMLEEAAQSFHRVLNGSPSHAEARIGLAQVALLQGKASEAAVRAEQILSDTPDCAAACLLLARIHITEGDLPKAKALYDKGVALNRSLADPGIEKDLHGVKLSPDEGAGRKRAGITSSGSQVESAEDHDDDDGHPRGGAAFDLGLADFEKPKLNFSNVGGMEALKEEIRMKIIYPLQHAELFKAYDKKIGGGVLLYGPPGVGKTLISKATAGEIKANFIALGLHQILDMWIGNSEKNMHEVFELARQNAPSILFFDEVDALAADRRDLRQSAGRNLINAFLSEMDGAESDNDGVLIIGATNAPWHIDPAFRRPGRFDRTLFVPPPDEAGRAAIIEVMAQKKPVGELDPRTLAKKTDGFSGADLKAVFDLATEEVLNQAMKNGKVIPLTTKDLIKAASRHKPTTKAWFESAKNYAMYSNQSGFYDDVLKFLGLLKR
ncbi:MAG: AAA family ATPase [Prosthecobacter sp.]|jgi:transitional endoplasmic reticulum ATPase|uniref:ATP-binding protein n=1 Tax=Prosthecobacter sp. TaxID=1965333 RepID=UPI0019F5DE47|nr:AAA family ATPase [Prosthecobacter sp.]MBE2284437.1 AAA family ATPase [Prosthecobacter sp.]